MLVGAIEAGGTKFVAAVGDTNGNLKDKIIVPTKKPEFTLKEICEFFKNYEIKSIGIGSFGPVDLNEQSKTYGFIRNTPKMEWKNYDILGYFKNNFNVPVSITTDVGAAALGEVKWGAAKNKKSCLYITIGTGIGGGFYFENLKGGLLQGLTHPEMGHIFVENHQDDKFKGICPYHHNCLEGMASGPAIAARWQIEQATELEISHKAWEFESFYIAKALVNYILILSPLHIVLGGGVMEKQGLMEFILENVPKFLGNYIDENEILFNIDKYITKPGLKEESGIKGALYLALLSLNK